MKKLVVITALLFCVSCSHLGDNQTNILQVNNNLNERGHNNKINVLIVDGQSNHTVWAKSTVMMKQYLEETQLFTVEVYRTKPTWKSNIHPEYYALHSDSENFDVKNPETDVNFMPMFSNYDVIVSNFGWKAAAWPETTQKAFEMYMENGGGFVSIHSADNAFPEWLAYNKMIGLGGWGGRNEKDGPYVYYNDDGELIRDSKKGNGGTHGEKYELQLTQRNEHPILKGLPKVWMHTKDECYGKLRGPAENLTVIATALCHKERKGTGRHEPMLMTIDYGQGRIFHSTLGHEDYSFESVGFITTFLRGVEWAATAKVTQAIPSDFPTENTATKRLFVLK